MRLSVTFILLIVFVIITGVWVFLENKTPAGQLRMFAFDPNNITKIDIDHAGHSTRLHKKDDQWRIVAPFSDEANSDLINQLINFTLGLNLEHEDPIPATGGYGISAQALTISMRDKAGEIVAHLRVGDKHPTRNSTYIQQVDTHATDGGGIYLATGSMDSLGTLSPDQFRNPFLSKINPDELKIIRIEKSSGSIVFEREKHSDTWQISQPFVAPADNQKVDEMINNIIKTNVLLFIPEKLDHDEKKTIKLKFTSRDDTETTATIFRETKADSDTPRVLARVSRRPLTLCVDPDILEHISFFALAKTEHSFFTGDFGSFDSIIIEKSEGENITMRRIDGAWKIATNNFQHLANAEKIQRLIDTLSRTRAWHKISPMPVDLAPYGLSEPRYRLSFYPADTDGKQIRLEIGSVNDTFDYVSNSKEIFAVEGLANKIDDYGKTLNDWRATQIFDLYGQKVTRLERIFHPASGQKESRNNIREVFTIADTQTTSAERNGTDISQAIVQQNLDNLIYSLPNLVTSKWLNTAPTGGEKKFFMTIKITTDTDQEQTLEIAKLSKGKNKLNYYFGHLVETDEYCMLQTIVPQAMSAAVIDPAWLQKNKK